jgi:hypothetical protein
LIGYSSGDTNEPFAFATIKILPPSPLTQVILVVVYVVRANSMLLACCEGEG